MIETFRMVAKALGWKSEEVKAMTGHVLRPTGAQYLARCGVEYYKVQLFCRWGSDTILRYLREAPLEDSEAWVADSLKKASATEVLCQTAMTMNQESDEATFASKDVDQIISDALDARASEVLSLLDQRVDNVKDMIETLKAQRIKMDDHWAGELSRRFFPRFVLNFGSNKLHAVRDAQCTGCGFEWRNSKEHDLRYEVSGDVIRCEAPGCQKLFKRFES